MANNVQLSTVARNALLSGGGSGFLALMNSGRIKFYSGSQPATGDTAVSGTLLAAPTMASTAFTVSGGVATLGTITPDSSPPATGTAGYAVFTESDNTTVLLMCSVGTSGCDINLSSTAVVAGTPFALSSVTLTMPAS
jgi:hypothetical protein